MTIIYSPGIGVTPPQFDTSTKLATMAAVQQAIGSFSGFTLINISGSGTGVANTIIGTVTTPYTITGTTVQLSNAAFGTICRSASGVACTVYLPNAAGITGQSIFFVNDSGVPFTIAVSQSGAYIYASQFGLDTTNTSITLQPGQSAELMNRANNEWDIISGAWLDAGYSDSNVRTVGSTSTAGNITLTAAQIDSGYFADSATQTAAFTFTTDTAANILAQMAPTVVGGSRLFRFINNDQSATGFAATLAVGTGVTLGTALPNPAVPKGAYMEYLFTCTSNTTGSAAFTVTPVGGNSAGVL